MPHGHLSLWGRGRRLAPDEGPYAAEPSRVHMIIAEDGHPVDQKRGPLWCGDYGFCTKLSSTFFLPAFSNSMVSLLPSIWSMRP